jgi:hypothetical protein
LSETEAFTGDGSVPLKVGLAAVNWTIGSPAPPVAYEAGWGAQGAADAYAVPVPANVTIIEIGIAFKGAATPAIWDMQGRELLRFPEVRDMAGGAYSAQVNPVYYVNIATQSSVLVGAYMRGEMGYNRRYVLPELLVRSQGAWVRRNLDLATYVTLGPYDKSRDLSYTVAARENEARSKEQQTLMLAAGIIVVPAAILIVASRKGRVSLRGLWRSIRAPPTSPIMIQIRVRPALILVLVLALLILSIFLILALPR